MSTSTLKGGHVVVSEEAAAAMVMAAWSVAKGRLDGDDDPTAAAMSADDAASSMLEKGSCNKMEPRILVFRRNRRY